MGVSQLLKEATAQLHRDAESHPCMRQLLTGRMDQRQYAEYLRVMLVLYEVLEELVNTASGTASGHPLLKIFRRPELARQSSIRRDLHHLNAQWQAQEPPRTAKAVCQEFRERCLAEWEMIPAMAYVRYFGDLAGGRYVLKALNRHLNLNEHNAGEFYRFDGC